MSKGVAAEALTEVVITGLVEVEVVVEVEMITEINIKYIEIIISLGSGSVITVGV